MDGHLCGPIDPEELVAVLEQYLSDAPSYETPSAAPAAVSMSSSIFDRSDLLERLDGDEELVQEILAIFLEDTPVQIGILQDALAAGDAKLTERQAHSLKGSAANVGAHQMREAAYAVETAAKSGALESARSLTPALTDAYHTLHDLLGL
jgi:HPt (histidine-containing phosphotransfer) domain-containing protein